MTHDICIYCIIYFSGTTPNLIMFARTDIWCWILSDSIVFFFFHFILCSYNIARTRRYTRMPAESTRLNRENPNTYTEYWKKLWNVPIINCVTTNWHFAAFASACFPSALLLAIFPVIKFIPYFIKTELYINVARLIYSSPFQWQFNYFSLISLPGDPFLKAFHVPRTSLAFRHFWKVYRSSVSAMNWMCNVACWTGHGRIFPLHSFVHR